MYSRRCTKGIIAQHRVIARDRHPGVGGSGDVVEQEMWRDPGIDHDLAEVLGTGRQVLGPGRYETLHRTGELEGRPVTIWRARVGDDGSFEPLDVQPDGGRRMPADAWRRGLR